MLRCNGAILNLSLQKEQRNMNKFFNFFRKKKRKIDLIKFHLLTNQHVGVIGWLANDRKTFVKGEDRWKREGELKR